MKRDREDPALVTEIVCRLLIAVEKGGRPQS